MNSLHIFILCHNRPVDTRNAIASVLAQTDRDFILTVSDNSSNDEVEQMVRTHYPEVRYVRRKPMLPSGEHFCLCIDEAATSDYFVLFHDDDLMATGYVKAMRIAAGLYPEAVAIGCNAWTESVEVLQPRPYFQARHPYEVIDGGRDMAYRYFGRGQSGIAPLPGYVYRTDGVGSKRPPLNDGKYGDTLWLIGLADKGQMLWVREPLMVYRLHGGNDGMQESRRDRLRVLVHIKRNEQHWGSGLMADYRCSFIYKTLLKSGYKATPQRIQLARAYLRAYRWKRYLRLDTYQSLLRRALVKWGLQT